MGGIYGGVFTPTEAAAVAAVYSAFIAVFIYRDMGPLKETPWVTAEDGVEGRIGFNGIVYFLSFWLVFMIISFFIFADNENMSFGDRALIGLGLGAALGGWYMTWRGEGGIGALAGYTAKGLPILLRNLATMGRMFFPALMGKESRNVTMDATRTTVMLMFIIANALLFAHTLSAERIPQLITEWMLSVGFNWFTFLILLNVILLIGGQFMEPSGLLLIVAPVVFPIAMELGIDPIHLGIIMVVNMEIGMITPPIGLNLFVTSGITGMSLARVVKAAAPL